MKSDSGSPGVLSAAPTARPKVTPSGRMYPGMPKYSNYVFTKWMLEDPQNTKSNTIQHKNKPAPGSPNENAFVNVKTTLHSDVNKLIKPTLNNSRELHRTMHPK